MKNMIKKEGKIKIEEICHNLNNTMRVRFSASPMEMFFNRPVKGYLPNQFVRENKIRQWAEKRITEQFKTEIRKGRYNKDEFVQSGSSKGETRTQTNLYLPRQRNLNKRKCVRQLTSRFLKVGTRTTA